MSRCVFRAFAKLQSRQVPVETRRSRLDDCHHVRGIDGKTVLTVFDGEMPCGPEVVSGRIGFSGGVVDAASLQEVAHVSAWSGFGQERFDLIEGGLSGLEVALQTLTSGDLGQQLRQVAGVGRLTHGWK